MLYGYRRWDCLPWLSEIPAAAVSNCLRDSAVRLMLKNPRYPFVGGQGTGCNYSLAEPSRPLSAVKQWLLAYELRRSIARKLGGKKTLISFSLSLSIMVDWAIARRAPLISNQRTTYALLTRTSKWQSHKVNSVARESCWKEQEGLSRRTLSVCFTVPRKLASLLCE